MPRFATPARVVIAGAGIGGLEALLALHALAGRRVAVTVLAPTDTFEVRAARVGLPFGRTHAETHDVRAIVASQGASLRLGALRRVRPDERCAVVADGEQLFYDALIVATGAEPHAAYADVITVGGPHDSAELATVLGELEAGRAESVAFVVPPGVTWSLPVYEVALMTASHVELAGLAARITVVTPEPQPVSAFGGAASEHVRDALAAAGVELRTDVEVHAVDASGTLLTRERTPLVRADRVVALPRLMGPAVDGLRCDELGFIPVDARGRVAGIDDVWAIGDATTGTIKHGGLAAQQAENVAHQVAQLAGAPVAAPMPRPVLRAQLLEGTTARFLRAPVGGGTAVVSDEPLWWPPLKVAAPRLARHLEETGA